MLLDDRRSFGGPSRIRMRFLVGDADSIHGRGSPNGFRRTEDFTESNENLALGVMFLWDRSDKKAHYE